MKLDKTNDRAARNNSSAPAEDHPAEYLEREAGLAYGDIVERLREISDRLAPSAAVAKAVKSYPWQTAALASALGLCAGTMLAVRRRRKATKTAAMSPSAPSAPLPARETAACSPWWLPWVGPALEFAGVFTERWAANALTPKRRSSD